MNYIWDYTQSVKDFKRAFYFVDEEIIKTIYMKAAQLIIP